ncbi:MAG: polysaccharide biosynthesis protein [Sediminibacterium sp.]|jgi:FlaA1/EpsC-like NDP-sugar epimerase|nr:polysaccharide biosynthesis protein [Sediminibacterium sp.]
MIRKINILPRWIIFLIDIFVCGLSLIFAYIIRNNLNLQVISLRELRGELLILTLINAIVFINFRTFSGIIRYTGIQDAIKLFMALAMSTTVLFFISMVSANAGGTLIFSNVTLVIYALISFPALISYRVLVKFGFAYLRNYKMDQKKVIIYGAGQAGFATKRVLEHDTTANVIIAAFLDDDPRKLDKVVDGIKIIHPSQLSNYTRNEKIDELIIAHFSISPARKNEIVDFCLDHGIKVLNVPPLDTWINGQFSARQLQTLKIENLLEREPIKINNEEIGHQLKNKRILVTGAAGSIGSEIVRQLLKFEPQTIVLCDQAETPLHHLELELQDMHSKVNCVSFLGDVRNRDRMNDLFALYEPHYVYHAAAYKHVPMMELCPQEAILTNVMGTRIIADLSVQYKVRRFVMVSTDKAVNPTNVMGASKRLAEAYVQHLHRNLHENQSDEGTTVSTKFITTRFGNVLGSNGSVIIRFKEQIEKGGPITVTHPNITRFFMTIPEACQLVLEAGSMGKGGEIFVFDMGKPVSIADLAKKMIRLYGYLPGVDIDIKFTGLRPGEKLYEELLMDSENTTATYHEKIMIARIRNIQNEQLPEDLNLLFELARHRDATMELVTQMKKMVPEFLSNNSVFESLDQRVGEGQVVPIARIS